nr:DNA-binding protein [Erythrobacter sp. LQ02-29]
MPSTKRRVNSLANREGWRWIERTGRGGGRLYRVADLPQPAREDLVSRFPANTNTRKAPGKRGRPAGRNFFTDHSEIADAVVGWLASRKLSAAVIREMIAAQFDAVPSLRTLQRFIAAAEDRHALALQSLRDPSGFKSTRRLSLGRADAGLTRLLSSSPART